VAIYSAVFLVPWLLDINLCNLWYSSERLDEIARLKGNSRQKKDRVFLLKHLIFNSCAKINKNAFIEHSIAPIMLVNPFYV
jgi:hypothetical protein